MDYGRGVATSFVALVPLLPFEKSGSSCQPALHPTATVSSAEQRNATAETVLSSPANNLSVITIRRKSKQTKDSALHTDIHRQCLLISVGRCLMQYTRVKRHTRSSADGPYQSERRLHLRLVLWSLLKHQASRKTTPP